MAIFFELRYSP